MPAKDRSIHKVESKGVHSIFRKSQSVGSCEVNAKRKVDPIEIESPTCISTVTKKTYPRCIAGLMSDKINATAG